MKSKKAQAPAPHTPAPWVYRREKDFRCHVVRGPQQKFIAEFPDLANGEADARLISAAPELLEALKISAEDTCSLQCPSVWKTGEAQPHTQTCVQIRAAIAKAEGAEQEGVR